MSTRLGVYASSRPIITGVFIYEQGVLGLIGNRPDENRVPHQSLLGLIGNRPDENRVPHQSLLTIVEP